MRQEFEQRSHTLEQRINALAGEAAHTRSPPTQESGSQSPPTGSQPSTANSTRGSEAARNKTETQRMAAAQYRADAQRLRDARRARRKTGPSLLDSSDLKVAE